MPTSIEWTDETWNPVTGCTKVSPGCDNCYAETFAERWRGTPGHHFENGFDLTLRYEAREKPLHWKRPRRVFVNSMSDLFHKDVPVEFIFGVFDTMAAARMHTFQVLTKRPDRMRRVVRDHYSVGDSIHPNVWLGVSIESNDYAWRADLLRETPAAVRFLSVEPMLGPIDKVDLTGIDWVIVGGESGRQARPMHPQWARDVRDRCVAAGIPYFFKQHGEWEPREWKRDYATHAIAVDGEVVRFGHHPDSLERAERAPINARQWQAIAKAGKRAAGRILDGRTWDEFPRALVPA